MTRPTIQIDLEDPDERWYTVYETVRRVESGGPLEADATVEIGPRLPAKGTE